MTGNPDANLQELCDLYRRRWDEVRQLSRLRDEATKDDDTGPEERETDRLLKDNEATRADILSTKAHTVAGVLAKLKHHYADPEIAAFGGKHDPDDLPGNVAASVYRDLERLAGVGKPATVTTRILYGFLAPLMRQERAFLSEQVPYLQCEVGRIWKRTAYLDAAIAALDASFGREDMEDGEED